MALPEVLADWAAWMRAAPLAERTVTERTGLIELFAARAGIDPLEATWRQLAEFLADPTFSIGTVHTYGSHLRTFYGWAVRVGLRVDDPTALLPKPRPIRRVPHPITTSELEALLNIRLYRRTRMMILLAAFQGLRVHEIAKIRGQDIRGGDQIRITGKGAVTAMLPLHPVVIGAAASFPRAGYWFPSPRHPGRPVAADAVSASVVRAMRRAGVSGTAHSLRHWFATELLRGGANIRTVQESMRHASLASTQIYTKVDDAEIRAAITGLPVPLHIIR
jgi:site-specific recombinase XerD